MVIYKFKIPKIRLNQTIILNHPTELTIEKNHAYCLIGDNGVGKTTLLNYLTLSEEVIIERNNQVITNQQFKKYFAYIPSTPPLFELMTGIENIKYVAALWGIKDKENYYSYVKDLCKDLQIYDALSRTVNTYSLGMKYKLFFISMYARKIDLFILDEPFTALDSKSQEYVITLLKTFSQKDKSIIFTTHIDDLRRKLSTDTYEIKNKSLNLYL